MVKLSIQNTVQLILIGIALSGLSSCAHEDLESRVNREASQEEVKTPAALDQETAELIETSPGLSVQQRQSLRQLRLDVQPKLAEMWAQSIRLRSVLVKDMISAQYNEDESELIKSKLRGLEDQRLALLFDAVDRAKKILGKDAAHQERLMNRFLTERGTRD